MSFCCKICGRQYQAFMIGTVCDTCVTEAMVDNALDLLRAAEMALATFQLLRSGQTIDFSSTDHIATLEAVLAKARGEVPTGWSKPREKTS